MVSSRNKRTHPNFVCRREKSTFFVFFQGLCASFLRPLNTKKLLLSFCSTFWGILRTGFHSDCIRQKRECSPSVDWTEIFWPQAKKNCIIAKHVHTRRFAFSIVCSSFDSGPCVACLVRMWDEVLLLNNWDNNCLFCSRTRLWIAMALRWVNSRNSHISLATISLRLLT